MRAGTSNLSGWSRLFWPRSARPLCRRRRCRRVALPSLFMSAVIVTPSPQKNFAKFSPRKKGGRGHTSSWFTWLTRLSHNARFDIKYWIRANQAGANCIFSVANLRISRVNLRDFNVIKCVLVRAICICSIWLDMMFNMTEKLYNETF